MNKAMQKLLPSYRIHILIECHKQNVSRNMNISDFSGEVLDGNEEHGIRNRRQATVIIKRGTLDCFLMLNRR